MNPLEGIKVIDLSTVLMGPYATQILADYGATVIKVETPDGDSTRHTGPSTETGMSAMFLGVNRGKQSAVLDLKSEAGRTGLCALIADADVFVHRMRPQKLAPLGIDPAMLIARHPRLVYVGLHGFAEGGPYAGRPAYDDIIQGLAGNAALMHAQTGQPGYFPSIAADKTCALAAAHAVLAALFRREKTGIGGFVEVPMFETMAAFNLVEHLYGAQFDPPQGPYGYTRLLAKSRRPFQTADGYICMMPYTDLHWRRFFAEGGEPAFADDPRFATIAARTHHIAALYALAGDVVAQRTTAAWLESCERLEIPAAPVNRLDQLVDDPQLVASGFFGTMEDAAIGTVRFVRNPVRMTGLDVVPTMPPRLGEHTAAVLRAAGLDEAAVKAVLDRPSGALSPKAPPATNLPVAAA
jgi:crotonobetainyl-CoA:carnitine CoA-transferase CaiB-like acyl-CoA transferase